MQLHTHLVQIYKWAPLLQPSALADVQIPVLAQLD